MNKLVLKRNEDRRIKQGHLWVFSNEIEKIVQSEESGVQNGDLIEINDYRDNYIATGFYNANSLITARVLTSRKEFDLSALLEQKLLASFNFRKTIYPNQNSFRIVFSESDFLPGLIIDKYNNTFVLQINSFGMERNINLIVKILKEKFCAENIFTKNEEYFRQLEGLPAEDKIYSGKIESEIIDDGNVKYKIDFESSHKTGFYFDQCDNREFARKFCKGKAVLDCFCNSGGFGLHAAKNGAHTVTFVDSSKHELENARSNFTLNGFSCESEFVNSDLFDFLEKCVELKRKFDVVIIDPPAFAKNKKSLSKAIKGYEKLNRLAMEVVNNDGLLFTSSCSYHLKENQFIELINSAAIKAGKQIQLFHFNNASKDHPVLPSMEETVYLKFAAIKVM
ncbi:MAG: class I SAM-dependent rRNA methyltransferase [Melioribacteraceae bacterium]|nr:class I SAM-dependent rRNA methyltransferase [Melioribacteraceae bacterium]